MFKPSSKVAAALGVATIAGMAGMVAVAPAATAAEPVKVNVTCKFPAGLGMPDATLDIGFVLEMPAKVAPGQNAVVKVDMGQTVPSPVDLPAGVPFSVLMDTSTSGGTTTPLKATGTPGTLPALVKNQPIVLPPFNATIPVPANATADIDLTLTHLQLTAGVKVECAPNTSPKLATIAVDVPAPAEPTLATSPAEVKPGGAVTVTGTNWPAGTPKLELCDSTGAGCDDTKVTGPLTVAADGKLSGTATIGAAVADGAYQLKVTVGDKSKTSNVSVKAENPSTERKVTLTPNHGPVGTKVTVTGEGYTPNKQLYVVPTNAAQQPDVANLKTPTTDAQGKFSVEVTVAKDDITLIAAAEDTTGTLAAAAPFTVDGTNPPVGQLKQDITGTIAGGALTISQENGAIKLSDVTLNGTEQAMTGALNTVTVKDFRAGNTGWTLTGAMTDFGNGAGGTIAAEKFTWTPKVTSGPGSPSQAVAGSTGPIGKAGATLASAPNAETTGGTFKADAELSLAVPAYQAIGNYSATLTLSIS